MVDIQDKELAGELPEKDSLSEMDELRLALEKCKKEAEGNLNGWKRAKADYLNLEREIVKKRQHWQDLASWETVKEVLPIWLSYQKLINNLPAELDQSLVKGFYQIEKMLADFFKRNNVEKIETDGQPFNPDWHEAVGKEKREQIVAGTIIKEITPGYKINDKLVMPPKVIVAD